MGVGRADIHVTRLPGARHHVGRLHKPGALYIAVLHAVAARRWIKSGCANGMRGRPTACTGVVRGGHLIRRASLIIGRLNAHCIVCLHIIFHHDCIESSASTISHKEKAILQWKDTSRTNNIGFNTGFPRHNSLDI